MSKLKAFIASKWFFLILGILLGATVLFATASTVIGWVKSKVHPANAPGQAAAAASQPTV